MKKVFLTICCLSLLVVVASGLWVTGAIGRPQTNQAQMVTDAALASGLTIPNLVRQSELIITGQCLRTSSAWIDRRLVTRATISVGEALKGQPASTVDVVLPGGVDANRKFPIAMTYAGAPTIQSREDVFLFLKRSGEVSDSYSVTGFAEGKFSIVENDQGQKMVSADLTKTRLKSGSEAARGSLRMTPLSEFKQKVKDCIK